MPRNIRCANCQHYKGSIGWCETAKKNAGGRYRRSCTSFELGHIETPSHGNTSAGFINMDGERNSPMLVPRYSNHVKVRCDH
jgi:hypothetical protein